MPRKLPDPHPCECGCGGETRRRFVRGHDSRGPRWYVLQAEDGLFTEKATEGDRAAFRRAVNGTSAAVLDVWSDRAADAVRHRDGDVEPGLSWAQVEATDPRFRRAVALEVAAFVYETCA